MRALVGALVLALVSASTASAQATGGAEDNLKQKNIALPPPATPVRTMSLRYASATSCSFPDRVQINPLPGEKWAKIFRSSRAIRLLVLQG